MHPRQTCWLPSKTADQPLDIVILGLDLTVSKTLPVFFSANTCPKLVGDANARIVYQSWARNYAVHCANSRTLFGPYGFNSQYAFCRQGSYYFNLNGKNVEIGLRAPDCVGELKFCLYSYQKVLNYHLTEVRFESRMI